MRILVQRIVSLFLAAVVLAATFIAQERAAPHLCNCPTFTVRVDWDRVKAGDVVEFAVARLEFANRPSDSSGKFEWTVSRGTIVDGQGTSRIFVQTTQDMLTDPIPAQTPPPGAGEHGYVISFPRGRIVEIKATAKFVGVDGCNCGEASESVQVGTQSIARNVPADVTGVKLSTKNLVSPCEPAPSGTISNDMIADVESTASDLENDVITYEYTVSGGRIIGRGAKVKWDLTGVTPGTYTITVGVDDGCGICGKTWTEEVTVGRCR